MLIATLHDFFYMERDCSHGLVVMTADFESASLGSIPSESSKAGWRRGSVSGS